MMIKDDHAGPPIPKAKGRVQAPNGADGAPCRWDEHEGCWVESDGTHYDKKAAKARKKARQRAARSAEQAQAAREANAARQQVRRDGRSTEQVRAERQADAARHCKQRGVTPLKQALMLPTGPRELQMLFDTHGSGSAFSTVNSRRLRTLDEGSALHAECVQDTANDLQLLCPVDVLDQYRMVKAFVERKEQAELLRVCGTCGVCDPSMWYCDPIKLVDIPSEHWCRIDPLAYERLLDAEPVKQMRRGRDGTFNERIATGVTIEYTQGPVEDPGACTWDALELPELSFCDLKRVVEFCMGRGRMYVEGGTIIGIAFEACTAGTLISIVSVNATGEKAMAEGGFLLSDLGFYIPAIEALTAHRTGTEVKLLPEDVDAELITGITFVAGLDNEVWVDVPWHEYHTVFEWEGQAYHVAPEAVEWLADDGTRRRDMPGGHSPHICVCKHCYGAWKRPRGEPLAAPKEGRHDDLYWQGAARNSTACGDDLGRLRHLEEEPYRIDTRVSRLEQLALAEVRTHYVSYKVRCARHLRHLRNCTPC